MAKVPVGQIGRGFFGTAKLWFKWGLFSIFIAILIINAVSISIKEKSVKPVIIDLGGKFVGITQELQKTSLQVIDTQGVYQESPHFWGGVWAFIKQYANFFFLIYAIYLWIKILAWIWGRSPFSNESQKFINLSCAVLTFYILQVVFLLVLTAPLEGQTKWDLVLTPIMAFKDFFRAVPYLLKPASSIAEKIVTPENITESFK